MGYLQTYIYSEADGQSVTLTPGSDDGLILWLDTKEVFRHDGYLAQGESTVELTLRKGVNRLVAAVANNTRHHTADLRITTAPR